MAPSSYTIKIPNTSTAQHPKPHTIYNITLALPLQTLTLQKRYSDFLDLHSKLTTQAGSAPAISPPPKSYTILPSFLGGSGGSSTNNPALIETRRRGLEEYLQHIAAEGTDARWRETPAWRAFLNLPSTVSSKSSTTTGAAVSSLRTNGSSSLLLSGAPTGAALASDPALWLDTHREAKTLLQEARKRVSARAAAESTIAGHEESAEAKKSLVRAAGMISALDGGLKSAGDEWGRERLGEGEMRRRRDLVATARKEMGDLEGLLSLIGRKRDVEAVVEDLSSSSNNNNAAGGAAGGRRSPSVASSSGVSGKIPVSKGRVLGKETAKTRELDNTGVLQLQQQMMREQDEDIDVLTAAVRRQRELATQINEELAVQSDLLELLDEDVDRVDGKIRVASKRADKIK